MFVAKKRRKTVDFECKNDGKRSVNKASGFQDGVGSILQRANEVLNGQIAKDLVIYECE